MHRTMRFRGRPQRTFALSVALALCLTGFCGITTSGSSAQSVTSLESPAVPPCTTKDEPLGVRWIVSAGALHHSLDALPLPLQQTYFASPCTFLIAKPSQETYAQWNAIGTISIKSYAEAVHCCDAGVGAVLYDPESWQFTPAEEQQHPGEAACKIAEIVHAKHRLLIAAPAIDLVGPGKDRYGRFVAAGIAGSMAKCADIYSIQSQSAEPDAGAYRPFVSAVAAQARKANLRIVLLAGASTNPNGRTVTAEDVHHCVQSVADIVTGYWLNIPGGGAYCPNCGEPKPAIAAELLRLMSQDEKK